MDTGRKLNVQKTYRRRPGSLLNVLCTFNLRPVSTENLLSLGGYITRAVLQIRFYFLKYPKYPKYPAPGTTFAIANIEINHKYRRNQSHKVPSTSTRLFFVFFVINLR